MVVAVNLLVDEEAEASEAEDGAEQQPDEAPEQQPRKPRVRARTESMRRFSKRRLEAGRQVWPASVNAEYSPRPAARGECLQGEHGQRPCPYVSCAHHLYLDTGRSGALKLNFPHLEPWEIPESCALDVADREGITLEQVGEVMNLTCERIRQLETRGLRKLRELGVLAGLQDYVEVE